MSERDSSGTVEPIWMKLAEDTVLITRIRGIDFQCRNSNILVLRSRDLADSCARYIKNNDWKHNWLYLLLNSEKQYHAVVLYSKKCREAFSLWRDNSGVWLLTFNRSNSLALQLFFTSHICSLQISNPIQNRHSKKKLLYHSVDHLLWYRVEVVVRLLLLSGVMIKLIVRCRNGLIMILSVLLILV